MLFPPSQTHSIILTDSLGIPFPMKNSIKHNFTELETPQYVSFPRISPLFSGIYLSFHHSVWHLINTQ